jgi:hypothetical protein
MSIGAKHLFLAAPICVLAGPAHADAPAPKIPDKPAGQAFSAWLDVINSADLARQESFLKAYPSWLTVDSLAKWSADVGSYELLEVIANNPTNVFFRVRQKRWNVEEVGSLKRATLVGETTVGGSGAIEFKAVDDHFTLVVPTGRVISPITKTDWVGTGVEPDVKVSADEALEVAKKLAAEAIGR